MSPKTLPVSSKPRKIRVQIISKPKYSIFGPEYDLFDRYFAFTKIYPKIPYFAIFWPQTSPMDLKTLPVSPKPLKMMV